MNSQSEQQKQALIDDFGRRVDYVRLSVTDRCDFRCVYCMSEKMEFLPKQQVLTLEEIYNVAASFSDLGVKKIRPDRQKGPTDFPHRKEPGAKAQALGSQKSN